jgi:hypothetical protein
MKQLLFAVFMGMAFSVTAQDSSNVKPKKRPIDKVKIWKDGKMYDADDINVICVYDDFESSAKLYYELKDSTGMIVTSGNIDINGADYLDYATKPNHPDRAVILTMKYLNIQTRAARQAIQQKAAATKVVNN